MPEPATPRRWTHGSVKTLMQIDGGSDPEKIIREKARAEVARAKGLSWSGPPYDPRELASLLGIQVRKVQGIFSEEAQLRPINGRQLLLEFNPERAQVRQNYSICHEIAHTFFPDCYEMVRYRRSDPVRFDPEREVEDLCQIGASELLMPVDDFRADLAKREFSLESVPELSQRYQASREAVVRRMVTLSKRVCVVVFFSKRLKPSELDKTGGRGVGEPVPKMRVVRAAGLGSFPVYIPPHKSVPDDSCVNRASMIDHVLSNVEQWDLPGFGRWRVEAMGLPIPLDADEDSPSVMALVHTTSK